MSHGLRGFILAVAAVVLAGDQPPSPFTLLESFEQALSIVTAAADRRMDEIERASTQMRARGVSLADLLDLAEARVARAEAASRDELDRALALAPALSLERRAAALDCIERYLADAGKDLSAAIDGPDDDFGRLEVAEYRATYQHLRAVRALVRLRARLV